MSETKSPTPNFSDFDVILINTSAGKDSQAMMDRIVEIADSQGIDRSKLVAVHADLGRVEWEGTRELAEAQADHYGIRFIVTERTQNDLLDHVRDRGMWPSNAARYCTSDHKRGPVLRVMTQLVRELGLSGRDTRRARILNCMGLRAAESPARAKLTDWEPNTKATTKTTREVINWLPIHEWTDAQVWERIEASGVPSHPAYELGMPRLSCSFCVLASRPALVRAAQLRPGLAAEYVEIEAEIGHRFRQDLSMAEIVELAAEATESGTAVSISTWSA